MAVLLPAAIIMPATLTQKAMLIGTLFLVLVTELGPVTRCGCGALCPSLERACYGCFGPTAEANESALADQFVAQGLSPAQARQRLNFIHAGAGGA